MAVGFHNLLFKFLINSSTRNYSIVRTDGKEQNQYIFLLSCTWVWFRAKLCNKDSLGSITLGKFQLKAYQWCSECNGGQFPNSLIFVRDTVQGCWHPLTRMLGLGYVQSLHYNSMFKRLFEDRRVVFISYKSELITFIGFIVRFYFQWKMNEVDKEFDKKRTQKKNLN